ncbi:MAG TPA: 50S ribosomal protein L15 [Caulifigura sp.]|nr:50S ribosomal protein L15 [Caulifigura sp.]
MIIDDVHRGITKNKQPKRVGRGCGSGHGKTSGRGHKGQGSRRGTASKPGGFAGGQMPLFRTIAKRGFNNRAFADNVFAINISLLEDRFEAGDEVSPETLKSRGIVKANYDKLKILGNGELTKKLTVKAHQFSASAQEKITKAGGKVEVV